MNWKSKVSKASAIVAAAGLMILGYVALAHAQGALQGDEAYQNAVHQAIKDNRAGVKICYEEQLKSLPGLAGDLQVLIGVKSSGKVGECKATETTFVQKYSEISGCVCDKIKEWQFPKSATGAFEINYTFKFKPEDPKEKIPPKTQPNKGKK